jgi:MinD-like ATPase involved in chromosome partitioning or flagellar assembly
MFVATFYSYKGGVGRSMALLNTAHHLASRGRSVVLIDFDLEAPGLHSAVTKVWDNAKPQLKNVGVLDYFSDYKASAAGGAQPTIPDLGDYLSGGFGPKGQIRLMTSGDLSDFARYSRRLAELNIINFADRWYGRELLLELRAHIAEAGCDYLLIDSRTGHTDALGATTVLLPHAVVLLSNLSDQSIVGTRRTLDLIRLNGTLNDEGTFRAGQQASNLLCARDPDDPEIETLVVASPLPFGDQTGLQQMAEVLGRSVDYIIYHVPRIAAHESEHVIKDVTEGLASQISEVDPAFLMYSGLADRIETLNPYEPRSLAKRGLESLSRQDWRVALGYFRAAERFLRDSEDNRSSVADRMLQVRLWLGKARALALGFQTDPAKTLIGRAEAAIRTLNDEGVATGDLAVDLIVARMQLVRGLLGANELVAAIEPAQAARNTANQLRVEDKPDHWKLSTGLMAAEAKMLGGDYAGAADEADKLPRQAKRLNRRAEMVRALQLSATARLSEGHIIQAKDGASLAVKEAEAFRVDYLVAEAHLAAAQVEIMAGTTSPDGKEKLERAALSFEAIGDGLGSANCRSELGMYQHRLGEPEERIRQNLTAAILGYQRISGTALGEITTLLYATRALIDRGVISLEVPEAARPTVASRTRGKPHLMLPALTAAMIAKQLPHAAETLVLAAFIAREREIPFFDDLIAAYWMELELFADGNWLDYVAEELGVEDLPALGPEATRYPSIALEVERSRLLARMLERPAGDAETLRGLRAVADTAHGRGAAYDEACALTLAALTLGAAGEQAAQEVEFARLQELHARCTFQWTIWGHVRAVRDCLRDAGPIWKPAAASLLAEARERGLPTPP